ncbi:MAG: hypothetical protein QOC99_3110 [Acidobacteriota bacterium]|nr:hypothetical protein [Acidobacteriota bacterium]
MSLPEISRRCRSCGGAVRAGARFCPQCGVLMEAEAVQTAESVAPEPPEAEASREWTPPRREFSAFVQSLENGESHVDAEKRDMAETRDVAEKRDAAVPPAGSVTEASGPLAPEQTGINAGDAPRLAGDAPRVAGDGSRVAADTAHVAAPPPPRVTGEALPDVAAVEALPGVAAAGADSAEDTRARVARMREGTRARVGKMREEALVVLEETPDDSGLRFVVAAAALFLVFLFLLFLSTTVLR